jgi:hypothetical protein
VFEILFLEIVVRAWNAAKALSFTAISALPALAAITASDYRSVAGPLT